MSSVSFQLFVVAVTLSLSDVACQAVHNVSISDEARSAHISDDVHSDTVHDVSSSDEARYDSIFDDIQPQTGRLEGPVTLSPQQIEFILDHHNKLRASVGAADMERLIWNTSLASMSAAWVARCLFGEYPSDGADHPEYNSTGMNYLFTFIRRSGIVELMSLWEFEQNHYNYETMQCSAPRGGVCSDYVRMVSAKSRQIGCAEHRCLDRSSGAVEAIYTARACHYRPVPLLEGERPYTKGPACSKCGSGAGWCRDRLCCPGAEENCSCSAICHNCATLDRKTCRCSCTRGWYGPDCSVRCEDTDQRCNKDADWSPSMCDRTDVRKACPAMCQQCTPDPNAIAGHCQTNKDRSDSSSGRDVHPPGDEAGRKTRRFESSAHAMLLKSQHATMVFVIATIILIIIITDDEL